MDPKFPSKRRIQRPSKDKKAWSKEEDTLLLSLVATHGITMWSKVSEALKVRSGKQCRERYHNHLDPNVKKGSWTKEEDDLILSLQKKYGNAWAKITSFLPGRTDNAVKNRYWSATRSKARRDKISDYRASSSSYASSSSEPALEGEDSCSDSNSVASIDEGATAPLSTTTAMMHFNHNLKVTIPTQISAVDYMSDEELSASFLDWGSDKALSSRTLEPAIISPSGSTCSSDTASVEDGGDDLLDVADFFQLGSGDDTFDFDMMDGGVISAGAVIPAL